MKDECFRNENLERLNCKIVEEHWRQIDKWGVQDRTPFEWLAFITEEVGEMSEAISKWWFEGASPEEVIKEAIQTATLTLKVAEMFMTVDEDMKRYKE